jgi:hypothetical protein
MLETPGNLSGRSSPIKKWLDEEKIHFSSGIKVDIKKIPLRRK